MKEHKEETKIRLNKKKTMVTGQQAVIGAVGGGKAITKNKKKGVTKIEIQITKIVMTRILDELKF